MTKRFGASFGVAWRQLEMRSVRNRNSSTRASRPTASAETWSTANAGRSAICRVARMSQRGAPVSGTDLRRTTSASQESSAKTQTAPAKPPTAMRPSFRSLATASSSAEKPSMPAPSTAIEAGFSAPTSRRMTRSGGTRASCSTGGRATPKGSAQHGAIVEMPAREIARDDADGHGREQGREQGDEVQELLSAVERLPHLRPAGCERFDAHAAQALGLDLGFRPVNESLHLLVGDAIGGDG